MMLISLLLRVLTHFLLIYFNFLATSVAVNARLPGLKASRYVDLAGAGVHIGLEAIFLFVTHKPKQIPGS
jgi:hypothetical protein